MKNKKEKLHPLKVTAAVYQEAYVSPAEVVENLKKYLGFREKSDTFICVRNGKLVEGEDISYHGSPQYEYTTISDNPKWIELFNSIKCLEDYIQHSDEPQWDKLIGQEGEQCEDEDIEPDMKM